MTLRVAVFSDAIPGRNGVGTYYDDLVTHLEERLEGIRLIAPSGNGSAPGFPRSLPMPGDRTQRIHLPAVFPIWREVTSFSPDVIVSATPGPFGNLGMALAARTGAGFCVGFHTEFDRLVGLYWRRSLGPVLRRAFFHWERLMFRRAVRVVVHNQTLRKAVLERGVDHVRVVGTPTPPVFLSRPLTPASDRVSSVAFVGRLAPEKRLDQVLESARAFPELRFRIVGDGPLRDEVDRWAREESNVEALGWVDRPSVLRVLDEADVLVLPSRYETFGSIALEAMVRGRLALVSPHCGISRWPQLADGLVVMEEEERLVEALRRVCAMTAEERRERACTARSAGERLTRDTIGEWLAVIESAAGSRCG